MAGWSRIEVEATVASYFEMLVMEIGGETYSKTEYRRRLVALLDGRSEGAVEYKHQNITAILIEIGFPWIEGYKPSGNYQTLLREVVVEQLAARPDLREIARRTVEQPAPEDDLIIPSVDDFVRYLADAPQGVPTRTGPAGREHHSDRPLYRGGVDYFEREARNRSLGAAGEHFVLNFETARLRYAGCRRLAEKIEHTSAVEGDAAGFDVRSFETTGEERLIEVKTTRFGAHTPFYVSRNQVDTSKDLADVYHLYRVFTFERDPRLFTLQGPLSDILRLEPTEFLGTVR
ncbi:MAG: DUF3883 domain-containing protein [Longimicrobiales bacterium]|nr:DUF3883 domain-containing protein [Longimicrobiales bacterium]